MKRYLAFLLPLIPVLALSCVSVRYNGEERAATKTVDTYESPEAVSRPYEVLGTLEIRGDYTKTTPEGLKQRTLKEAAKRGADAVIYVTSEYRTTRNTNYTEAFEPYEGHDEFREPEVDETWLIEATLIVYTGPAPESK